MDDKQNKIDGVPRDLLESLDSLLSWIAHRGWRVDLEEDRRRINDYFIPELRKLTNSRPCNYEQELSNLNNALAESVLEMSDEDIEEEIRAEGLDPQVEAERTRQVLRDALSKFQANKSACKDEQKRNDYT